MREQIINAREIVEEILGQARGLVELMTIAMVAADNQTSINTDGIRSLQELAVNIEVKADEALTELYKKPEVAME